MSFTRYYKKNNLINTENLMTAKKRQMNEHDVIPTNVYIVKDIHRTLYTSLLCFTSV